MHLEDLLEIISTEDASGAASMGQESASFDGPRACSASCQARDSDDADAGSATRENAMTPISREIAELCDDLESCLGTDTLDDRASEREQNMLKVRDQIVKECGLDVDKAAIGLGASSLPRPIGLKSALLAQQAMGADHGDVGVCVRNAPPPPSVVSSVSLPRSPVAGADVKGALAQPQQAPPFTTVMDEAELMLLNDISPCSPCDKEVRRSSRDDRELEGVQRVGDALVRQQGRVEDIVFAHPKCCEDHLGKLDQLLSECEEVRDCNELAEVQVN